jgi:hypothetical protein
MPHHAIGLRVALLALVVLPACCVDATAANDERRLSVEQVEFWHGFLREEETRRAAEEHSVDLESAELYFRDARFADALTAVKNHLAKHPHHQRGLDLQRDIIACVRCFEIRCTADDILRERR